jgi:hypothetical protein
MIDAVDRREEKLPQPITSRENSDSETAAQPPTAYIAACGTLCDAFWWARRSFDPEKPSD